jgi:hypothetical protein
MKRTAFGLDFEATHKPTQSRCSREDFVERFGVVEALVTNGVEYDHRFVEGAFGEENREDNWCLAGVGSRQELDRGRIGVNPMDRCGGASRAAAAAADIGIIMVGVST